jgi:hypothetical protein
MVLILFRHTAEMGLLAASDDALWGSGETLICQILAVEMSSCFMHGRVLWTPDQIKGVENTPAFHKAVDDVVQQASSFGKVNNVLFPTDCSISFLPKQIIATVSAVPTCVMEQTKICHPVAVGDSYRCDSRFMA